MNNNVDVLKQLEVKNKEIYLNKLNIDLDNNQEILQITINNIMDLLKKEMYDKLVVIIKGLFTEKNNIDIIVPFIEKINNEIKSVLEERKNNLKNKINDLETENYRDILSEERNNTVDKIGAIYKNYIGKLYKKISNMYQLNKEELSEYLTLFNYENLINKIRDSFINMDAILYNNYLESYNKFLNLNSKTLK